MSNIIELSPSLKGDILNLNTTLLVKGNIVTSTVDYDGKIANVSSPDATQFDSLTIQHIKVNPQATRADGTKYESSSSYSTSVVPNRQTMTPFPLALGTTVLTHGSFGSDTTLSKGIVDQSNGKSLAVITANVNHYLANNLKDTSDVDFSSNVSDTYRNKMFLTRDKRAIIIFGHTNSGYGGIGQWDIQQTVTERRIITIPELAANPNVYIKKLAGAYNAAYALLSNGNLYVWGYNGYGQLGMGNTSTYYTPTLSKIGINNIWTAERGAVESSGNPAYVEDTAGDLWACGLNGHGQLGVGNTTNQTSWIKTNFKTINSTGIKSIQVEGYADAGHAIIHTNDDKLYGAGYNGYYQFGDGTTTNRSLFSQMFQTVTAYSKIIKVKTDHGYGTGALTMVLLENGQLWACGDNASQFDLGLGSEIPFATIPQQMNLPEAITDFDVKGSPYAHGLALGVSGKLYAWGRNGNGQLGLGDTINRSVPNVTNVPLDSDDSIVKILVYSRYDTGFSLVLTKKGFLLACGYDGNWNLGINSGSGTNASWTRVGQPTPFVDIRFMGWATEVCTIAIDKNGSMFGAGNNWEDELSMRSSSFQKYRLD